MREGELALGVGDGHLDDLALLQSPGPRPPLGLYLEQGGSALEAGAVVGHQDRLRRVGEARCETREGTQLHQHLEAVAYPTHGISPIYEIGKLVGQLRLDAAGEDGPGANVVARGEASGDEQDLIVLQ
jgi:hypothetical protein